MCKGVNHNEFEMVKIIEKKDSGRTEVKIMDMINAE